MTEYKPKHAAPEPNPYQWLDDAAKRDKRRTPHGRCVVVEDGLDGFVIHAEKCPNAGKSWLSGSNCIGLLYYNGPTLSWMIRDTKECAGHCGRTAKFGKFCGENGCWEQPG